MKNIIKTIMFASILLISAVGIEQSFAASVEHSEKTVKSCYNEPRKVHVQTKDGDSIIHYVDMAEKFEERSTASIKVWEQSVSYPEFGLMYEFPEEIGHVVMTDIVLEGTSTQVPLCETKYVLEKLEIGLVYFPIEGVTSHYSCFDRGAVNDSPVTATDSTIDGVNAFPSLEPTIVRCNNSFGYMDEGNQMSFVITPSYKNLETGETARYKQLIHLLNPTVGP